MRLVLDTNVIVAALRSKSGASACWLEHILHRRHIAIVSVPLVLEYEAVLNRAPMLQAIGLDSQRIGEILDELCEIAERVPLTFRHRPLLKDPGDEMVLDTAVVSGADALLTFNLRDFAGAETIGIRVMTPGAALKLLKV